MTQPLRPRDPLRKLANFLMRREEAAAADEDVSQFVEAILRMEKAGPEDLTSIAEIESKISELETEKQSELANQLAAFVQSILPHGRDILSTIEDTRLRGDCLRIINLFPQEQRSAEIIQFIVSLLKSIDDPEQREEIFEAIKDIPEKQRAAVLHASMPLLRDLANGSQIGEVIGVVGDLAEEGRDETIALAMPVLYDIQDGDQRLTILHAVSRMPKEQRPKFVEMSTPLIQDVANGYERAHLLFSVSEIPEAQREEVIEAALLVLADIEDVSQRRSILQAIRDIFPEHERVAVVRGIAPQLKAIPDGSQRAAILLAICYIAPDDRERLIPMIIQAIKENRIFPNKDEILQFVFEDEKVRDNNHTFLKNMFESTFDVEQAERLAMSVTRNAHILVLHDEHPLFQLAIYVQTLTENLSDPRNPYTLYKNLQELSRQEVTYSPPLCAVVEGARFEVRFDLRGFQRLVIQEVRREDLPEKAKMVQPDALDRLTEELEEWLEVTGRKDEVLAHIRKTYDYSFEALKKAALENDRLRKLLSLKGDLLDLTEAYFFAIISFIQDQPNTLEEGQLLTPREQSLMQMARMMCTCEAGTLDGIFLFYRSLPERYKISAAQEADEFPETKHVKDFVATIVDDELSKRFSASLIQKLLGIEGPIEELPHQILYVKNLIGHIVGLSHQVTFDLFTMKLYLDLIQKTRKEVLGVFYELFTPGVLIRALEERVPKPVTPESTRLYNAINTFLSGENMLEVWEMDEDFINVERITPHGALALLQRAGFVAT